MTEIRALKAYNGDAIFIKTVDASGAPFTMLIDGGPPLAYDFRLRNFFSENPIIDVYVLTHIDNDHIGAFLRFVNSSQFDSVEIKKFWINCKNLVEAGVTSTDISYDQARRLEQALENKGVPIERFEQLITTGYSPSLPDGLKAVILSPRKSEIDALYEDWPVLSARKRTDEEVDISGEVSSQIERGSLRELANAPFEPQKSIRRDIVNSTSISFILEGADFKILLLADSRSEIIEESLKALGYNESNKLLVDLVKVSHHGSRNNTSSGLLDMIESPKYLISTNGGGISARHPDREVIGRIIFHSKRDMEKPIAIYFNYPLDDLFEHSGVFFTSDELKDGRWAVHEDAEVII